MPRLPSLKTNLNLRTTDGTNHNIGSSTMVSDDVEARVIGVPGKDGTDTGIPEYTNPEPVPYDIGGILSGETFNNIPLTQMWDKLLYPFLSPSFSTFSIVGRLPLVEVGDTFDGGIRTFNWSTSYSENIKENTISVISSTSGTLASLLPNDGTENINIGIDKTHDDLFTEIWTISAVDDLNIQFNTSTSISWRWNNYFGYSEETSLTGEDIINLQSNVLSSNRNGNYVITPAGFKYLAYPVIFGEYNTFKDPNGFDIALAPLDIVSVTNSFGITADYYVYRTLYYQNGEITMVVT